MRLIDADALKDEFCDHCATLKRYKRTVEECRNYIDPDGNRCFKMRYIDSSPTIEAEPVVRCERCKHCKMVVDIIGDTHLFCGLSSNNAAVQFGDFCSNGERKEDTP